jgi:hypothetical protein
MNTKLTTTRSTRTTALAACFFALVAGATACGTEDGTASAKSGGRPPTLSSNELVEGAKTSQQAYLQRLRAAAEAARQLRAERADAARWAHGHAASGGSHPSGDDHRNSHPAPSSGAHHSPGFDKALRAER